MIHTARIISIYAADTSGVCSALYELNGLTAVHDASGCNSTYSTHDEPRWFDYGSRIYISALTEMDAVMGNDEKFIGDVIKAAKETEPDFIAVCGSPMPMMTGTDFDAIGERIESESGIPVLTPHTNGMHSYLCGESQAIDMLARRFCKTDIEKTEKISANIIGATPLDFSLNGSFSSMCRCLNEAGIDIVSTFTMKDNTTCGGLLESVKKAGSAWVNLVVSYGGLKTAEYLKSQFGTPYLCGVPAGKKYSAYLIEKLIDMANGGNADNVNETRSGNECGHKKRTAVVGESVYAASLAEAINMDKDLYNLFGRAGVLCPLETERGILPGDAVMIPDEDDFIKAVSDFDAVIADRLYKPVCPAQVKFYELDHEAFSGRCFAKSIPDLIGRNFKTEDKGSGNIYIVAD